MAINYNHRINNDVLEVNTWGFDEDQKEAADYGLEILQLAFDNNVTKVYCNEVELEYKLSTVSTHDLAKLAATIAPQILKIALVSNKKYESIIKFYERVATERGLTIKIFFEPEEALKWLKEN